MALKQMWPERALMSVQCLRKFIFFLAQSQGFLSLTTVIAYNNPQVSPKAAQV